MSLRRALNYLLKPTRYEIKRKGGGPSLAFPKDLTPQECQIIDFARRFTMSKDAARIYPIVSAASYVAQNKIPGSIVECGVWRGGMMVAAAKTLLSLGVMDRDIYLFDTFAGMTPPTNKDVDTRGNQAITEFNLASKTHDGVVDWCYASLEDVTANMHSTGYPKEKIHFIKGKVEETLPATAPETISILRLDTDWYESSKHEMVHLFPRLQPGGVVILDDYGYWQGSRQATDEYLSHTGTRLHLIRVDEACRVGIKL
jgi:O-methyltransferase